MDSPTFHLSTDGGHCKVSFEPNLYSTSSIEYHHNFGPTSPRSRKTISLFETNPRIVSLNDTSKVTVSAPITPTLENLPGFFPGTRTPDFRKSLASRYRNQSRFGISNNTVSSDAATVQPGDTPVMVTPPGTPVGYPTNSSSIAHNLSLALQKRLQKHLQAEKKSYPRIHLTPNAETNSLFQNRSFSPVHKQPKSAQSFSNTRTEFDFDSNVENFRSENVSQHLKTRSNSETNKNLFTQQPTNLTLSFKNLFDSPPKNAKYSLNSTRSSSLNSSNYPKKEIKSLKLVRIPAANFAKLSKQSLTSTESLGSPDKTDQNFLRKPFLLDYRVEPTRFVRRIEQPKNVVRSPNTSRGKFESFYLFDEKKSVRTNDLSRNESTIADLTTKLLPVEQIITIDNQKRAKRSLSFDSFKTVNSGLEHDISFKNTLDKKAKSCGLLC